MKLNPNFSTHKITNPYEIWVLDNLFDNTTLSRIHQSWGDVNSNNWHTGYQEINGNKNILEHGMKAISDITKMPLYLQEILKFFHSEEFTNFISSITNRNNLIPDETMRWSGLRLMEKNSYQLIHSDARKHPNNNLTKELTCLFYLNEDYNKNTHEGCLEIWDDTMQSKTHDIEPIDNRLVVFVNSETSYHGVPKVLYDRKLITFSIMSDNTSSERSKALFVKRPEDSDQVSDIGIQRSKITDKSNK